MQIRPIALAVALLAGAAGSAFAAAPASTNFNGGLPAGWSTTGLFTDVLGPDDYVSLSVLFAGAQSLTYSFDLATTSDLSFSFNYLAYSTANNTVFTVALDSNPAVGFSRTNAGGSNFQLGLQGAAFLAANPGGVTSPAQLYNGVGAGNHTITFALMGGSLHGAKIDNFNITATPVPEPETYAMMLAGLGALGFVARRRKQG